jgi:hypothetical protein
MISAGYGNALRGAGACASIRAMTAVKSSSAFLAFLVVLAACSDAPNTSRTGAFNLDELTVAATVVADDHQQPANPNLHPRATLNIYEGGRDLFVGEGDTVLLVSGNLEQPVNSTPDLSGVLPHDIRENESLQFAFVRDGRRHVIPLPLPAPFALLAPAQITMGDKVTIDLQPRPALSASTKVSLTILGGVVSTATEQIKTLIVVPELPWVWDTSTLRSATAGSQFTIRVLTEIETKLEPFAQGPFAASSKITARRAGTSSDITVRR